MGMYLGKFCRAGLAAALLAGLVPQGAAAMARDAQIDQARQCTMHFPKNERLHGIPTHLLAAIASTESGRWNDTLGMVIPWPWTLNADGKGYYFNSKAEAVAKVKELQRRGANNIDVGCMQVSLKHHKHAFSSVEQALDPQHNVAYAATFLRRNYDDLGNWTQATAAYHSRTPRFGNKYLGRVEKSWNSIVGKVREARTKRGLSSGQYAVRLAERERQFASLDSAPAPQPVRSRPTVKVIEVSDAPKPQSTIVIKPKMGAPLKADKGGALQQVASASSDLFVTQHGLAKGATTTRLSATTPSTAKKVPGPKFIFVE